MRRYEDRLNEASVKKKIACTIKIERTLKKETKQTLELHFSFDESTRQCCLSFCFGRRKANDSIALK